MCVKFMLFIQYIASIQSIKQEVSVRSQILPTMNVKTHLQDDQTIQYNYRQCGTIYLKEGTTQCKIYIGNIHKCCIYTTKMMLEFSLIRCSIYEPKSYLLIIMTHHNPLFPKIIKYFKQCIYLKANQSLVLAIEVKLPNVKWNCTCNIQTVLSILKSTGHDVF